MAGWTWPAVLAGLWSVLWLPPGAYHTLCLLVYLLLAVNVLLGLAIGLSWISTSASLVLTEIISSAICSPFAIIMELKIEVLHLVPNRTSGSGEPRLKQPATWLKQLLLASLVGAPRVRDVAGLSCFALYLALRCAIKLSSPSALPDDRGAECKYALTKRRPGPPFEGVNLSGGVVDGGGSIRTRDGAGSHKPGGLSEVLLLCLVALGVGAGVVAAPWLPLAVSILYGVLSDRLLLGEAVQLDFGKLLQDDVGGLDELVARGLYMAGELLVAAGCVAFRLADGHALLLPVALLNIAPTAGALIAEVVRPMQREQRALRHFRKASRQDIRRYDDICAICLVRLQHGKVTPCEHIFHTKCLRLSLEEKRVCPMCKAQLDPCSTTTT